MAGRLWLGLASTSSTDCCSSWLGTGSASDSMCLPGLESSAGTPHCGSFVSCRGRWESRRWKWNRPERAPLRVAAKRLGARRSNEQMEISVQDLLDEHISDCLGSRTRLFFDGYNAQFADAKWAAKN